MKTLRFSLVVVLLSVMAMSYADNHPGRFEQATYTKISLEDACASRSFVHSIYQQVDQAILRGGDPGRLIYAKVRHGRCIYLVFGKYAEWEDFFLREGGMLGPPDWNVRPK